MDGSRTAETVHPSGLASQARSVRHVFVRDFVAEARIGVYAHEKTGGQRVRINVDLEVADRADHQDKLENVVCYNRVVEAIRTILAAGHIHLAETLAEQIAGISLADERVLAARVRVEKLDVIAEAASVGVEIERRKKPSTDF